MFFFFNCQQLKMFTTKRTQKRQNLERNFNRLLKFWLAQHRVACFAFTHSFNLSVAISLLFRISIWALCYASAAVTAVDGRWVRDVTRLHCTQNRTHGAEKSTKLLNFIWNAFTPYGLHIVTGEWTKQSDMLGKRGLLKYNLFAFIATLKFSLQVYCGIN